MRLVFKHPLNVFLANSLNDLARTICKECIQDIIEHEPNNSYKFSSKNISKRCNIVRYNRGIMQLAAYLVINQIQCFSYGFLFNCTMVGQASAPMTNMTQNFSRWVDDLFLSLAGSLLAQLVVFLSSDCPESNVILFCFITASKFDLVLSI